LKRITWQYFSFDRVTTLVEVILALNVQEVLSKAKAKNSQVISPIQVGTRASVCPQDTTGFDKKFMLPRKLGQVKEGFSLVFTVRKLVSSRKMGACCSRHLPSSLSIGKM